MRITVDGAFWHPQSPPSARHVTHDLVVNWARRWPEDTLLVSAGEVSEGLPHNVIVAPNRLRRLPQAVSATMLGGNGTDVVITHNFPSRRRGVVSAAILHDVLFVDHPEWFTRTERAYFALIRPSLRSADVVLTTSETQTARIAAAWPETASRLRRVGLAPSSDVVRPSSDDRGPSVRPPDGFVLVVGRLNTRKNLGRLVAAMELLRATRPDVTLVVVGARNGRWDELRVSPDLVRFTGTIDDAELAWYYRHCALFVFPSLGEGFGLPIVEARALGARVVCSDLPEFRELACADAYFDPRDVDNIAATIEDALDSEVRGHTSTLPTWPHVVERIRDAVGSGT